MSDIIKQAADQLVESYSTGEPFMQHLDRQQMPSTERIVRILEVLQTLMFPGFFGERGLTSEELKLHVATQMAWLYEHLTAQIRCAFAHLVSLDKSCGKSDMDAINVAGIFLSSLRRIRTVLATDVEAAFQGDPIAASYDEVIASYPSVFAVMTYRLAHELHKLDVPLIPRIMTEHAHQRTGIDIHPATKIGEAFFIDHGTGVVIGGTAVIGNRVKIYQGVTLGAFSFPKDSEGNLIRDTKRHPTIEDDVVIYSGATILGGDTVVGKGSVIGGNVWLTKSVEPGTRVALDPPKLKIITPGSTNDLKFIDDYVI